MAQADGIVSNASGAAVRADLNNQLAAVFTNHSGATEPSTTYAYQWWADTVNGVMKLRNATNTAWITLFQLDGEWTTLAVENGSAASPSIYFKDSGTDTGVYSPGTDQVAITTAGAQRVNFNGTTEVVFNDGGADVDFRIEGDTEENLFKIDAGTDQVQVANLNGGPLAGFRNLVINGDMQISQRGTSSTGITNSIVYRTVDRFVFAANGTGPVFSETQSTTAPTGLARSLRIACTTADTSLDAGAYLNVTQRFEGFNCQSLKKGTAQAQQITASFWVRSSKTGTYCVELFDSDNTRQITRTYTISAANTWEYKTLTFAGDTSGPLDNDNNNSLSISFWLGAGTDFTSGTFTANTWAANTNANRISASQVNIADNTANEWYITGVQLEPGTVATPFERRSYGQELALCQRYYEYIYVGSYSPTATGFVSGARVGAAFRWAAEKRAAPSVATSNFSGTLTSSAGISVAGTYGGLAYADWNGNSGTRIGFECNLTGVSEL